MISTLSIFEFETLSISEDANAYFCCDQTSLCNDTLPVVPCSGLPDEFNSFSKQELICCSSDGNITEKNVESTTELTSLVNATTIVTTTTTTTE